MLIIHASVKCFRQYSLCFLRLWNANNIHVHGYLKKLFTCRNVWRIKSCLVRQVGKSVCTCTCMLYAMVCKFLCTTFIDCLVCIQPCLTLWMLPSVGICISALVKWVLFLHVYIAIYVFYCMVHVFYLDIHQCFFIK